MTTLPAIFDFPEDIIVEVEAQMATLIQGDGKWFVNFTNAYAYKIGTRSQDVKMVVITNETNYLDESHDGEICFVSGKLSIIKEQSTFVLKGVEF
jgi:hypothetical protein